MKNLLLITLLILLMAGNAWGERWFYEVEEKTNETIVIGETIVILQDRCYKYNKLPDNSIKLIEVECEEHKEPECHWEVKRYYPWISREDLEKMRNQGPIDFGEWEPFAVEGNFLWLKRKVCE